MSFISINTCSTLNIKQFQNMNKILNYLFRTQKMLYFNWYQF